VLANLIGENYSSKNSPLGYVPSAVEQSYIGCILPFGAFLGPFLAAPLISRIGRKFTLLTSSLFFIASYVILITTRGILGIYLARTLQGVGNGMAMVLLPIYVGEISSPECR
jgi:MFS family permease